jgi:hypothetical protein
LNISAWERATIANEEHIKAATSIYNANLGAPGPETSGVAINARQLKGETGTYTFTDNLSWSIRHRDIVLLDIIPKLYDTAQIKRIIGDDGNKKKIYIANSGDGHQEIKTETGKIERALDLSVGRYDIEITMGPAFGTRRKESAQAQLDLIKVLPDIGPYTVDLMVKSMDWPKAKETAKRLEHYLAPSVQAEIAQDEAAQEGAGKGGAGQGTGPLSPEAAAAMQEGVGGGQPIPGQESGIPAGVPAPPPDPTLEIKLAQEQEKLNKMQFDTQTAQFQAAKTAQEAVTAMVKKNMAYGEAGIDPEYPLKAYGVTPEQEVLRQLAAAAEPQAQPVAAPAPETAPMRTGDPVEGTLADKIEDAKAGVSG